MTIYHTGTVKSIALSEAFASWLDRYEWDWWATFTFREDRRPYSAKKSFQYFIKKLRKNANYFLAIEYHRFRYSVHCHALIGGVQDKRRLTAMDMWYVQHGICRIWSYDKSKGARYYLSKYIVKELADWDFQFNQQQEFRFDKER